MKSKTIFAVRMIAGTVTAGVMAAGLILATISNQSESSAIRLESNAPVVLQSNVIPEVERMVSEIEEMMLTSGGKTIGSVLTMQGKAEEESAGEETEASVYEVAVQSVDETAVNQTPLSQYFSDKAIVNGDLVETYLNMRSTPEDNGPENILAGVDADMIVDVVKEQDTWTEICVDGIYGWVKAEFLLNGTEAAEYVELTADPYAEVIAANMNIRMGKSTNSGILDVAYQGEAYPLLSLEDGWAYVKLGDILNGYLAGNCVTINYVWNDLIIATKIAGATDDQVINLEANPQQGGIITPSDVIGTTGADETEANPSLPAETQTPETQAPVVQVPEMNITPTVPEQPATTPTQPAPTPTQPAPAPTAPPETQAPETQPPVTISRIEAFYTGLNQKVEGDVVGRAEICVYVYYSDGSMQVTTEGWSSDDIGMILYEGEEVITIHYGGLSSNIVLNVAPAPTQPAPAPTQPVPAPTQPAPAPTQSAPTPTQPAPAPTAPPETQAPAQPAPDVAYVNNVALSGELTAYALKLCSQYGVDSSVIFSVMYQESKFNPNAVSGSGAIGLMQIIPRYSQDRMNRLGVTDLYDARSNMLVGIDLLAEYYHTYGSWAAALTQYRYGTTNASHDYANLILSRTSMFQ